MQFENKFINNSLLGLLLATGLVACGGGSDGAGSNTNAGTGTGTGGCVTFPRPVVGQIVKRELQQSGGGISLSKETEIIGISSTSITQRIMASGLFPESINIVNYTIANSFRDITSESTAFNGLTFNTTYTPFQRVPVDEVCEGQTWTTVYTEKEDNETPINHSKTFIIEAVNVPKTTAAGTFNTFRVKQEDVDIFATTWIDINSGYDVLSEFSNTSGNLEGILELVEKNF